MNAQEKLNLIANSGPHDLIAVSDKGDVQIIGWLGRAWRVIQGWISGKDTFADVRLSNIQTRLTKIIAECPQAAINPELVKKLEGRLDRIDVRTGSSCFALKTIQKAAAALLKRLPSWELTNMNTDYVRRLAALDPERLVGENPNNVGAILSAVDYNIQAVKLASPEALSNPEVAERIAGLIVSNRMSHNIQQTPLADLPEALRQSVVKQLAQANPEQLIIDNKGNVDIAFLALTSKEEFWGLLISYPSLLDNEELVRKLAARNSELLLRYAPDNPLVAREVAKQRAQPPAP